MPRNIVRSTPGGNEITQGWPSLLATISTGDRLRGEGCVAGHEEVVVMVGWEYCITCVETPASVCGLP